MTDPQDEAAPVEPNDAADASAEHRADRPPTAEEEAAAESNDLDPAVGEHYREMSETGAEVQGEGEITPP